MTAFKLPFSLSDRQKKILKWVGYPVFGVFMFLVFLYATLPVERFKEMAITGAARAGWDLEIGGISLGFFPGRATLSDVVLQSRPKTATEKTVRIPIDEVGVNVQLMKLRNKQVDLSFYAKVPDGKLSGRYQSSKKEDRINASGTLPMEFLPWLSQNVQNLPLSGGLGLKLDLTLPGHKWAKAQGSITLKCDSGDCTLGSDKALTGTAIRMGKLSATLPITKGVATFKNFKASSPDGELEIVGRIEFADPVANSEVKLCVRFKLDEELMQRADRMRSFLGFAYAGKLPDGRYLNRLEGQFGRIRGIWTQNCPFDPTPAPMAANVNPVAGGAGGLGGAAAVAPPPPPLAPPPPAVAAAPAAPDVPRPPLPTPQNEAVALDSNSPAPAPAGSDQIVLENPPPYPVAKRGFKPFPIDDPQPGQENFNPKRDGVVRREKDKGSGDEVEKEKEHASDGDKTEHPSVEDKSDKVPESD